MSLLHVIIFLLIVSSVVVEGRIRRKRRQASWSGTYSNLGYGQGFIGEGGNWYPLGNNWYIPDNQVYPYNYQFGYNQPQYPYLSNYGYPNWASAPGSWQYGASGFQNQYSPQIQAYIGQSYVPSNEWLPLPGVNRRGQSSQNVMISKMTMNHDHSIKK